MIEKLPWGDNDFHYKMGCVDAAVTYFITFSCLLLWFEK